MCKRLFPCPAESAATSFRTTTRRSGQAHRLVPLCASTLEARQNGARSAFRAATVMEWYELIAATRKRKAGHWFFAAETTTGTSTLAVPLLTVILADPGANGFTMLLGSTVTTLGVSEV
jgi:hypothetical protein